MSDFDPSGLQVVQPDNPADVSTGRSNGFLSLAGALSDASPDVHEALGQVSTQLEAHASARAQAAAMATSGEAFADAVREGKIEPTQNPWFIHAYNQNAAEVSGRAAMSTLLDQSQQWAERNDPAKYQARFAQEMGTIAQGYQAHPESLKGFETAATPIYNAAIASNQQEKVDAIHQQFTEDATSKLTNGLNQAAAANGGVLSPEAATGAITQAVQQWTSLGGNASQAKLLAFNSIVNHAVQAGDPDSLRTLLETNIPGIGKLGDTVGPNGEPIGLQATRDAFFITRGVSAADREATAKITAAASSIATSMLGQYGLGAGKVADTDNAGLMAAVTKAGITDPGAATRTALAVKQIMEKEFQGATGLHTAMVAYDGTDPVATQHLLELDAVAAGLSLKSPLFQHVLGEVAAGTLGAPQAHSLIDRMASTNQTDVNNARADERQARSDAQAQHALVQQALAQVKQYGVDLVGTAVHSAEAPHKDARGQAYVDTYFQGPQGIKNREALQVRINGAMSAYRITHSSDDVVGIQNAGKEELAKFYNQRAAAMVKAQSTNAGRLTGGPQ